MFFWTITSLEIDSFWQEDSRISLATPCPLELARICIREAANQMATGNSSKTNTDLVCASLDQALAEIFDAQKALDHTDEWSEGIVSAVDCLRHAIGTMQEELPGNQSLARGLTAMARALATLFPFVEQFEKKALDSRTTPIPPRPILRAVEEWAIEVVFE